MCGGGGEWGRRQPAAIIFGYFYTGLKGKWGISISQNINWTAVLVSTVILISTKTSSSSRRNTQQPLSLRSLSCALRDTTEEDSVQISTPDGQDSVCKTGQIKQIKYVLLPENLLYLRQKRCLLEASLHLGGVVSCIRHPVHLYGQSGQHPHPRDEE